MAHHYTWPYHLGGVVKAAFYYLAEVSLQQEGQLVLVFILLGSYGVTRKTKSGRLKNTRKPAWVQL